MTVVWEKQIQVSLGFVQALSRPRMMTFLPGQGLQDLGEGKFQLQLHFRLRLQLSPLPAKTILTRSHNHLPPSPATINCFKTVVAHMQSRLTDRAPLHRDQDVALHSLNQRHRLMNRITPALNAPGLLTPDLALLEVRKLPEVVHGVEIADLTEPSSDSLHNLSSRLQALAPVRLPLEKVAGVQSVGAQFE